MDPRDVFDREIEELEKEFKEGLINQKEYNDALRDIERNYMESANEAAQMAYENEIKMWES